MKIFIPNEVTSLEKRAAFTPKEVKSLLGRCSDVEIYVQSGAGAAAHYPDEDYITAGANIAEGKDVVSDADIVLRVTPATKADGYTKGQLVVGFMDPAGNADELKALAQEGVNILAMERIPRISRAQNVDSLSSQANIAGYRAVLEAASHYGRYIPLMMTSAGSAKPAKVVVMGAGVAGLQAIATARRLGSQVEAFDIRPEVKEQIESLGAKFVEFDLGEEGSGEGGYAKELSAEAKQKQQELLQEYLKGADIVITTALIPGRPAPILVTEDAVKGMREGSVIVDLAAANGGNCPLTEKDAVITKHGVTLVGYTNYPSMLAYDASAFYAKNLQNILNLLLKYEDGKTNLVYDMEDEIIAQSLVAYEGEAK